MQKCKTCGMTQEKIEESNPECTPVVIQTLVPIGDIQILLDGQLYVVSAPDSTPIRDLWLIIRLCMSLLTNAAGPSFIEYDVKGYLDEHDLWKYLTKQER